jgi:predicted metalloprotease
MFSRSRRPLRLAAWLVALALLAAGCGDAGSEGDERPNIVDILLPSRTEAQDAEPPPAEVPERGVPSSPVDNAPARPRVPPGAPAESMPIPGQAQEPPVIDEETSQAETLEGELPFILAAIDDFWSRALGERYISPTIYPAYERNGPRSCGGQRLPPGNAVYCPEGHFISWDETRILRPFYEQAGDMAAALVIAHEWGHAAQALLRLRFPLTIQAELQADCFAGAWARDADQRGMLEEGDLDEAQRAIFEVADPEGTPWTDPSAHGSFEQRSSFFGHGFENGAQACVDVMQRYAGAG